MQHLQYLPFGETFVDQQNDYDSRYTFSAKEKDDETQYSYFGARYYDSDLSVWLSVDPLSDKFYSTSPYMYVVGNPIGIIDPFGMDTVAPLAQGSGGVYLPDNATDMVFNRGTTATGAETGNSYAVNEGSLSSFKLDGEEYKSVFNKSSKEFIGYRNSAGQYYNMEDYISKEGTGALILTAILTGAVGSSADLISVSFGVNSTFVAGGGKEVSLNYLRIGPEKGFFFSTTESNNWGVEVDWGLDVSYYWYVGNTPENLVTRRSVEGHIERASVNLGPFGGYSYIWCTDENYNKVWRGGSLGGGFGLGAAYHNGTTKLY
ncbi:hypothetical protein SDC9_44739 [bioreactor metagenome]|uniref:RHS repeat-associated core domain-containing protein n=1 Tax=bioreactor metagenome TaxID=1076179 RepID=A0A644W7W0_9ZZZZ